MILEACVDSLSQALLAQSKGAHRIELCSRLDLDGLSPDPVTVHAALEQLDIPLKVMIRPRPGGFVCEEETLRKMEEEILFCREAGVQQIVFGVSLPSGSLDIPAIRRLADAAHPLTVTIHKAIDLSPDPVADMEALRPIPHITHILSSGKQPTALEGSSLLREMIKEAGDRFTIIAAGKVTSENLMQVHQAVGAKEYHGKKIVGEF